MKKKAIEKIPYLTLPEISRSRKVKFIAVTAFKNVGHERHLFVEVYRNKKKDKAVPVVRIVLTKISEITSRRRTPGHERKSRQTTIITAITSCGIPPEKTKRSRGMTP